MNAAETVYSESDKHVRDDNVKASLILWNPKHVGLRNVCLSMP